MTKTPIAAVVLTAGKGNRIGSELLWPLLDEVRNDNSKGEYYLTDIVALARAKGKRVATAEAGAGEVTGVNSQEERATLEQQITSKSGAAT